MALKSLRHCRALTLPQLPLLRHLRTMAVMRALLLFVASASAAKLAPPNPLLRAASAVVTPLLTPLMKIEAPLQASVTGIAGAPTAEEVQAEISATLRNPCVVYTYTLSPFCTEAKDLLEKTGAKVTTVELGAEWFLLGAKGSAIRAKLGEMTGQTSFPHVFIGGEHVGGLCSSPNGDGGLNGLIARDELVTKLKKARAL